MTDRDRLLRNTEGWFSSGREALRAARRTGHCVECGVDLGSHRRAYCSEACAWKFHGRYFWDAARHVVLRRDGFRCRLCGRRRPKSLLDVDHIVELVDGGPSLDHDNLQTLCRECHRTKTRAVLRERRTVRSNSEDGESGRWPEGVGEVVFAG